MDKVIKIKRSGEITTMNSKLLFISFSFQVHAKFNWLFLQVPHLRFIFPRCPLFPILFLSGGFLVKK